jgi:hypothetical protein
MENLNLLNFNIWAVIKILSLAALGLYVVFAFVITRQVKVMTDTLSLGFESVAKFLAFIHLILSIFIFIVAMMVL